MTDKRRLVVSLPLLAAVLLGLGCHQERGPSSRPGDPPLSSAQETRLVGTLQSGFMGIGGEHTGWVLATSSERIEVSVSLVAQDAQAFDGKPVQMSGTFVDRNYVERGKVRVFVARKIEQARP